MPSYIVRQNDNTWMPSTANLSPHLKNIVHEKVTSQIGVDPYNAEPLHYELEGLWSYNKLKSGYRIIYAICGDCRKKKAMTMNNCSNCKEVTDNSVVLWVFGSHDVYEDLKRARKKAWEKLVKQRRHDRRR